MKSHRHIYFKVTGTRALPLLILVCSLACQAQVYNYDPIRHNQFESNPSYLASGQYKMTAAVLHQGTFAPGGFYSDVLRLSLYSSKCLAGIGFSASHVHVNDSAGYSYASIGGAYRSVLFNRIYTRIGFAYKMIQAQSQPGAFTYYGFQRGADGAVKQQLIQNANVSVSFASAKDKYYVSAGLLNATFLPHDQTGLFPVYYFINAGDFAKMLGLSGWEASYTVFTKKDAHQSIAPLSHYFTLLYNGFHLTRLTSLRYGARLGYADASYFQCDPVLALYHRTNRKHYMIYQVACDAAMYARSHQLPFKPAFQFNITYLY